MSSSIPRMLTDFTYYFMKWPNTNTPPEKSQESIPVPSTVIAEEKVPLNTKKIEVLIAEDNPINLMIIRKKIIPNAHNYNIDVVENGEEVVRQARQKEYDVIITDQIMPKLYGSEAVKQIREFNSKVLIVVQSDENESTLKKLFSSYNVQYLKEKLTTVEQLNKVIHPLP
jgi:CheY-like chemotaxis protein